MDTHAPFDAQAWLSEAIHVLGDMLGATIREQSGEAAFELEEAVRSLAKELRAAPSDERTAELTELIAGLTVAQAAQLLKAFTHYFALVNVAEQAVRLQVLRARDRAMPQRPRSESIAEAVAALKQAGVPAAKIAAELPGMLLQPVFTAHPTESQRRTLLESIRRIAADLPGLVDAERLPRERAEIEARLHGEICGRWQSDLVRVRKPTVLDEVKNGRFYMTTTLLNVVPQLYRDLRSALRTTYPETEWQVPPILRFGSWMGGDRDGNPHVQPDTTVEAVRLLQSGLLERYIEQIDQVSRQLICSVREAPVSAELRESLLADAQALPETAAIVGSRNRFELYRQKCSYILARLQATLAYTRTVQPVWNLAAQLAAPANIYRGAGELRTELEVMERSLRANGAGQLADGLLADYQCLVDVFGLHMATLDIRQHASRHSAALDEILSAAGIVPTYARLAEDERADLLRRLLEEPRPLIPARIAYTAATTETIEVFRTITAIGEQLNPEAISTYIISMSTGPSDVLAVLLLAREAGLYDPTAGRSRLDIVPLYETRADLHHAPEILAQLLANPTYRRHLELRGNLQEVMLGYSDSNKDAGFVAANWALYRAQAQLTATAQRFDVRLRLFHGRGGSIGRGGGAANHAILAQPSGTVGGQLRLTEQGEVIFDRYGLPGIAARHLEQLLHAMLLKTFHQRMREVPADWLAACDELADQSAHAYRALVYEHPRFIDYFKAATPITEITRLNIGSRPSSRRSTDAIQDLRAIPWVFAWMQSRHTLPGWYGLGSALDSFSRAHGTAGTTLLRAMYHDWPFFRTLIDNAQMILTKADQRIAHSYAALVPDGELAGEIWQRIVAEWDLTCANLLLITDQQQLLDNAPTLQHSIDRRNPYIDPLSAIQIELLKRLRNAPDVADDELRDAVLLSINGIAAGLKNTG